MKHQLTITALLTASLLFNATAQETVLPMNLGDIKIDKYIELPHKEVFDWEDWKDGKSIILYNNRFSTLEITESTGSSFFYSCIQR